MIYKNRILLQEKYDKYLKEHQETGLKTYPDKLLALLLLQEKDNYDPEHLTNGGFYKKYKQQIDAKIEKVINDFDLTKEDIISFIEEKGILSKEENYESDKIWFVFCEGFGVVISTQRYNPSWSPEQAYEENYSSFYRQYKKEPHQRKRTIVKAKRKEWQKEKRAKSAQ